MRVNSFVRASAYWGEPCQTMFMYRSRERETDAPACTESTCEMLLSGAVFAKVSGAKVAFCTTTITIL